MPIKEYRPRLSIDIEDETLCFKLRNYLPYGTQKIIFNIILSDLILLIEKFGANRVLAAICERDVDLTKLCRMSLGDKNVNHLGPQQVYPPDEGGGSGEVDPSDEIA